MYLRDQNPPWKESGKIFALQFRDMLILDSRKKLEKMRKRYNISNRIKSAFVPLTDFKFKVKSKSNKRERVYFGWRVCPRGCRPSRAP